MPALDEWRRVHLRTPRPAAPRWAAPAAAAAVVLTATAIWAQAMPHRPPASAAPPAPPASIAAPAPTLTASRPGGVIEAAGGRWRVGADGDQVVEGDWDCDGRATLALLRPATGDLYRFDTWSPGGAALPGTPIARVPGARALRAGDLDGDRCDELLADGADGASIVVTPR